MQKHLTRIPIELVLILVFFQLHIVDSRGNETNQTSIFNIESVVEMSILADISYLINNREVKKLPAKAV
ncbi:MAG: hypothetical protein PVH48_04930, partial [Cyclobacteriaceae bacterium]